MNSKSNSAKGLPDSPIININIIKKNLSKSDDEEENDRIIENKDIAKNITQIKEKDFCNEGETLKTSINEQNLRAGGHGAGRAEVGPRHAEPLPAPHDRPAGREACGHV